MLPYFLFICTIAIAYSMGHIIKAVCDFASVCQYTCVHSMAASDKAVPTLVWCIRQLKKFMSQAKTAPRIPSKQFWMRNDIECLSGIVFLLAELTSAPDDKSRNIALNIAYCQI